MMYYLHDNHQTAVNLYQQAMTIYNPSAVLHGLETKTIITLLTTANHNFNSSPLETEFLYPLFMEMSTIFDLI